MPKKPAVDNDIDNDPMFDVSEQAINNAIDRQMVQYLDRVATLEDEKKGIADDIKDVWAEAKSQGYDTKMMKVVHALRKMKPDDRAEFEALRETYKMNCGL